MRRVLSWQTWLAVLLLPLSVGAASQEDVPAPQPDTSVPIIRSIDFIGNHVTREQILRQEMLVKEGDPADPSHIEQSRQAIMNLGLFVSVHVMVLPAEDGVALIFTIKEKYYILPVPKLNRDDENNFTLGAELSFDNIGGYNQQLKLRYETDESNTVADGELTTYYFNYRYPRIFGSAWLLQSEITKASGPVDGYQNDQPTWIYQSQARSATLNLSRWLQRTGPSQGWQAGSGMVWRRNVYDYSACYDTIPPPCPPPTVYTDSTAVGVLATLSYTQVSDFLFSRKGTEYGYNGEYGSTTLGSDYTYTRHEFYWRYYYLFEGRAHENIDMQARLGLASGTMFAGEQAAYSLGGSKTLRAYETGSISGDAYVMLTVQYLRPLFGYFPLRGVIFLDVGNAYRSSNEMHLGDLKWDVGVGLRLRLKSFVKIDLRLDFAYSPDTGNTRTFLGTKEIF